MPLTRHGGTAATAALHTACGTGAAKDAPAGVTELPRTRNFPKHFQQSKFGQTSLLTPPALPRSSVSWWSPCAAQATRAQASHCTGAAGSGKLHPARRAWRGGGGGVVGPGQAGLGTEAGQSRDGITCQVLGPCSPVQTQHTDTCKPFPNSSQSFFQLLQPPSTPPTPPASPHSQLRRRPTTSPAAGDVRDRRAHLGVLAAFLMEHKATPQANFG